jgi:hypothetical protein
MAAAGTDCPEIVAVAWRHPGMPGVAALAQKLQSFVCDKTNL